MTPNGEFRIQSPVVIFVLSGNRNYAQRVMNAVKAVAPVSLYLAGLKPIPSESSAEHLRIFLHESGLKPLFILAGHSFGGMTAICYRNRWPNEVAGMVLMDSTHPKQAQTALEALPPEGAMSSPAVEDFRHFIDGSKYGPEFVSAYRTSCRQVDMIHDLGSVPLIVLAAGKPDMPPAIEPALREKLTRIWHSLCAEYAKRSSNGALRIIPDVGHDLGEFEFTPGSGQGVRGGPSFIVQSITELVERCRKRE